MSIEKEDTIILSIQKTAHAAKKEVDDLNKEIKVIDDKREELIVKLSKSAERLRESLDYLTLHHPEGAEDWFKKMGTNRKELIAMETNN